MHPRAFRTYEPQSASDVFAMCECWTSSRTLPEDLLWKDVPPEHVGDFDFIISLLDWEKNIDPNFFQARFMPPLEIAANSDGLQERWIVYRSTAFSAKELMLRPGAQALVRDAAAYGCIVTQGRCGFGPWTAESPTLIRFGQVTGGRVLCIRASGAQRRASHQPQRNRTIGNAKALWPRKP